MFARHYFPQFSFANKVRALERAILAWFEVKPLGAAGR
jgi:hypothetical protein